MAWEALGDIDDKSAKDFQKQIDDLERKVKGKEATRSAFDKLREGVASLLKKQAQAGNPGSASNRRQLRAGRRRRPARPAQLDTVRRRGGSVSVLGSITVNTPSR